MTGSFPAAVRDRWQPGARFLFRIGRRTLLESLYLLTAPVTAAAGLLLALGGLCAGTAGSLSPGGSRVVAAVLAPARWFADLERWRIAKVRPPAAGVQTVAAVTAEAAALRRLERDIHDGPQQRLVRLAMELGLAQHHFDSKPEVVREALADAIVHAQEALDELRALSRGIAPPILVDRGLGEAVTALAARSTIPVELDAGPLDRRLDAAVETAAYFVIAEALTNVAKHSHARQCAVGLRHSEGTLRVWVTDDGAGGAALDKGHGLQGLDDRLHAVGGRLRVTSPSGGPTTITAELPCC
jgi:signal transduction histidine kinase